MLENVLWACAFVLAGIGLYRFGLPALKRFDEKNVARIAQQERDKADANAHFRHALEVAGEQVEPVEEIIVPDTRTGQKATHYLFEAEVFASRDEAEQMRASRVAVVARRFYQELPAALAAPSSATEPRGNLSARERAAQKWRRTIH